MHYIVQVKWSKTDQFVMGTVTYLGTMGNSGPVLLYGDTG